MRRSRSADRASVWAERRAMECPRCNRRAKRAACPVRASHSFIVRSPFAVATRIRHPLLNLSTSFGVPSSRAGQLPHSCIQQCSPSSPRPCRDRVRPCSRSLGPVDIVDVLEGRDERAIGRIPIHTRCSVPVVTTRAPSELNRGTNSSSVIERTSSLPVLASQTLAVWSRSRSRRAYRRVEGDRFDLVSDGRRARRAACRFAHPTASRRARASASSRASYRRS